MLSFKIIFSNFESIARLAGVIGIVLFVSIVSSESSGVEFVRPESYSIRRFQEVLEQHQKDQPRGLKEKLIRQRAKLQLTKEQLAELKARLEEDRANEEGGENDRTSLDRRITALELKKDHHQKRINLFEKKIRSN